MQCVILAGGLATRMRPLTETIPKALIPVAGAPFIDHQLAWLAGHGVTSVVLSIGYRGQLLRDHVGDGGRWGLAVRVVDEGTALRGTAGALRLAATEGALDDAFLVTYGDSFLPIDFAEVWRHFRQAGQPALMTVFRNAGRWDTSNVIFEDGLVKLYDKHHRTRPAADFPFIDYGLSALRRSVVEQMVPEAEASVEGDAPAEAGTGVKPARAAAAPPRADLADLFHQLSLRGLLVGFEARERFFEIGSPAGLEDFERWMQAAR
jgi:NDP-sugar pyrophosphorylase family protein